MWGVTACRPRLRGYPGRGGVNPQRQRGSARVRPRYAAEVTQLPALSVLAVVALGLAVAALVDWQAGALVLGLALLGGAGLRMALPARSAGWLAVRTRPVDAAVLLLLGFTVVVLANTIPRP